MVKRHNAFQGRSSAFRLPALAGIAAVALYALTGTASAASDSYTFAGLQWGSSPKAATQTLKAKGFHIGPVLHGPQRELVEKGAWGEFRRVDRGKRVVATGMISGQKANVQLIFGHNNRLDRVIVGLPDWNGTIADATKLTHAAIRLTSQLEKEYGATTEKRDFFGWPDTARWQPARDGSHVELLVRGTHGMMFYPGDKTGVRVNYWNNNFNGSQPTFNNNNRQQTVEVSAPTDKPVYKSLSLQ